MKAVLQNFRSGELSVSEVPPPSLRAGGLLVRNVASLISAGTEKAVIELAKMNPLQKSRARPDLVRKVLGRAKQEGLLGTAQVVMNLVSAPLPLGYSCAGIVEEVGADVGDFEPGSRVACAGLGYANHAEVIFVPRNLAVSIPENVNFEEASFVTIGAIAMHGVRQAGLQLGESVVVLGLGLVGQMAAQICLAAGYRVYGLDPDASRVELALKLGVHQAQTLDQADKAASVRRFTRERGADAIIICASTPSSDPLVLAAELARDRARVVSLGETGLDIPRHAYYEKELELRQSRSYGPGRYDPLYEEHGRDYPAAYVRWTENRNMEAFMDLLAGRRVQTDQLVSHRFSIDQATNAYALLTGERHEPYIGILLQYDPKRPQPRTITIKEAATAPALSESKPALRLGVIGAGQFAQGILLPRLRKIKEVEIAGIATGSGVTARTVADKYHCRFCTSDFREILNTAEIDAVLIATRHDLHARIVSEALAAGKQIFVEKPLALNEIELAIVMAAYRAVTADNRRAPILTVGYNRRFSPISVLLKQAMSEHNVPLTINYRINAGSVPADSWIQNPDVGGGRIVGEVCHFVDFMQFLTSAEPVEVYANALAAVHAAPSDPDSLGAQIRFSDGSIGVITYVANGDPGFAKERVEVFGGGRTGVVDNWRSLQVTGQGKKVHLRSWLTSAKGHFEELVAFTKSAQTGVPAIEYRSLILTARATFAIQRSLRSGQPVSISFDDERDSALTAAS